MQRREVLKAGLTASLASARSSPLGSVATAVGACMLTIDGDDGPFYFDPLLVRSDITAIHLPARRPCASSASQ